MCWYCCDVVVWEEVGIRGSWLPAELLHCYTGEPHTFSIADTSSYLTLGTLIWYLPTSKKYFININLYASLCDKKCTIFKFIDRCRKGVTKRKSVYVLTLSKLRLKPFWLEYKVNIETDKHWYKGHTSTYKITVSISNM